MTLGDLEGARVFPRRCAQSWRELDVDISNGATSDGVTGATPADAVAVQPAHLRGTVPARLAAVAAQRPGAVAVTSPGASLTYAELVVAVAALAERVRAAAVAPPSLDPATDATRAAVPVAVLAEQGVATVVAMFAVMTLGSPVVLLDPLLPPDRISLLAELSGAHVLVTDRICADIAGQVAAASSRRVRVLDLDLHLGADVAGRDPLADARAVAQAPGDDLAPASIIFTSGSTGQPKGVVLTHRTVLAGAHISRERLHLSPSDAVALVLPHAFAAGQEVAFMALLNGASLHGYDPRTRGMRDLPQWLADHAITTLHGTPSLVRAIIGALGVHDVLADVRLVTTCGEAAYGRDVVGARRHLRPDAVFTSWLGSSETGQIAYLELGPDAVVPEGALAAGTSAPLKEVGIVDAAGLPVTDGQVGDLVITSAHLSGGYWRDPERTAATFVAGPDGRTRYATGDRGWIDAGGVLHLAGRADDAVKIRGYLVEPADVEAALLALPGVAQVVVRGRHLAGEGPEEALALIGWVVPDPRTTVPALAALRKAARASLPEWMVPSALVLITSLPLTERGKLDADRLPDPPPRPAPRVATTEAQARMGTIWAGVLQVQSVDPDETFSELGGDSLGVEEMLVQVKGAFGVSLTLKDLAEHPSLADFAALAARSRGPRRGRRPGSGSERSTLARTTLRLRAGGGGMPVFCFAGNASHAAAFADFAAGLGGDHAVHAFQVNGLTNRGLLDLTIAANAARHLRDLRALAPSGPVVLVGHSLGGLFAIAAAHQLAAQGREVALLVLVDTFLPPRHGGHVGDWEELPRTNHHADGQRARALEAPPRVDRSRSPWRLLLRTLRQQEARVLGYRLMLLGAGPLTYSPTLTDAVMWQHGIWLARTGSIKPWAGRTILFTSEENRDPMGVWDELLTGPHEVVPVRGDHAGLLRPPYLREILDLVKRAIAQVSLAGE